MANKRLTKEQLLEISQNTFEQLIKAMDDDSCANPVDVMCVLAIMYRMTFANVEREAGIDEARRTLGGMAELIEITLDEGAWDEKRQMMK